MNPSHQKWVTGILVSVGIFVALLDTTIVDIVLPKMMASLETDLYGIQWVVIIYFVGAAVAMTAASWVARRIGELRTYLLGLGVFVTASAFCGAAWNLPVMLASRFIQGLGEGLLVPVGLIILFDAFPPEEHGTAMGLYGLSGSFSPALGPTLGGLITEHLNWRWVFYVNLPIGVLDVVLILFLVRGFNRKTRDAFDAMGFALISTALAALIVLLAKGQELGWLNSDMIVFLLVLTIVAGGAAVIRMLLARHPLFPRRIFSERLMRLAVYGMVLLSINAYGFFLLLPVFLQRLRGLTTLQAGLILLPGSILTALSTLASGLLCDRFDPRKVGFFFLAATAVASFTFTTDPNTPIHKLVTDYMWWGAAVGGTFAPVTLLALMPLKEHEVGDGSTLVNVARLVAGSIGTAFSTSLLSARTDEYMAATRHFLEPSRPAMGKVLNMLAGQANGHWDPVAVGKAAYVGQLLVRRETTSWAFQAVYQALGVVMMAGALVLLFALLVKSDGPAKGGKKVAVH